MIKCYNSQLHPYNIVIKNQLKGIPFIIPQIVSFALTMDEKKIFEMKRTDIEADYNYNFSKRLSFTKSMKTYITYIVNASVFSLWL